MLPSARSSPPPTPGAGPCSPGRRSRHGGPRSTRSTSSRCPTATPAPTSTSPSTPPSTRSHRARAGRHPRRRDARAGVPRPHASHPAGRAGQLGGHPQPAGAAASRRHRRARRRARPTPPRSPTASPAPATAAHASVAHPPEGTILTVGRRGRRRGRGRRGAGGCSPSGAGGRRRRQRGPAPAPPTSSRRSSRAGVVDAGAAGCYSARVLRGVVTGRWRQDGTSRRRPSLEPVAGASGLDAPAGGLEPGRRRRLDPPPAPPAGTTPRPARATASATARHTRSCTSCSTPTETRVATLRDTLDGLGDSLLVVGGPDLWNVHVHVDDAGAAVEAGLDAGRPYRDPGHPLRRPGRGREPAGREWPSSPAPPVPGSRGSSRRPVRSSSTADPAGGPRPASCSRPSRRARALAVIVLPSDRDTLMAAEVRRRRPRRRGHRRPRRARPHDGAGPRGPRRPRPARSRARNVVAMTDAAAATRHGAVRSRASRR